MTFAEAQDAIYVDFECLATKPPHPALLGVLVGFRDEHFEQIITDDRLAPARVASTTLQVATAFVAAGEVVDRANAENRRIVGWSLFDRDRLIEASPALKADINARYVNALQIARPWRARLHPKVAMEREDRFAPRHTLDKYADLAGYPDAARLRDAAPADWIRHTLRQLESTKGRYRRTTKETKRDWHTLLEYNRHDCLALRHIVLRATSTDFECWQAYEATLCVDDGGRRVCSKATSRSSKLDALLRRHGADQWAFLTRVEPRLCLPPAQRKRHEAARTRESTHRYGYTLLRGKGVGKDPEWPAEETFLVLGMPRTRSGHDGSTLRSARNCCRTPRQSRPPGAMQHRRTRSPRTRDVDEVTRVGVSREYGLTHSGGSAIGRLEFWQR